ncbi:hypothetical protein HYQ45_005866 [Verticillium longisporum]|uniref:Uncharacterized protein n=1 Tax=Verticillium longisporum TaxID=100787 RepID=A0A8I2ZS70_VERLO|nr:hypothetical protein HYQ45_005866 [Verticillium longisporum]
MGIGSKKFPPLPAPTETDIITPTELTTADDIDHEDDGPADEASHFSLPDDGTPITIKTRGHKLNRSQTSLLIEYFEGGKTSPSASGVERKPSVRVRLTPSKKNRNNHIQITETKSSRKTSLTRRVPLPSTADSHIATETLDAEDLDSMQSYASATEESNVSRNPIDIEIDRSERRRRPASPLIPAADAKQSSYMTTNMSDISAIPTDSFLDGSGPTNLTYREVEKRQSRSPSSSRISAAGGAGALAGSALADKSRNSKSRSETRDRIVLPKSTDKVRDKDRKQRSSKSRASSLSEKQVEGTRSPRRRSSRSHGDSLVSATESSVVSSALTPSHRSTDQQSVRSGASKSSINNPKLLETVEDAIRRLILPELSALKREQSKHEDLPDAEPTLELEIEETERLATIMLIALMGWMERAIAGTAAAGLAAAAALSPKSPVSDDRRQRRRRRADGSARSRSLGRDKYAEEYEEEEAPAPPMPLMSEINPSELTRTSILSAETEHPRSELEEYSSVQEVTRGDISATSSPSRSAATLQQTLGTRHANVSSGDLNAIPRQRIEDHHEDYQSERNMPPTHFRDDYNDEEFETSRAGPRQLDYEQHDDGADYYNTQDSNVASLVDGSMLDQSVLTAGSAVSENNEYGKRDSTVSYDAQSASLGAARGYSPDKLSVKSHQDLIEEREGIRTPTSSRHGHSQDFAGEYDLDEYGHKVAPTRYRNSPSTSRHSPTDSEKAIALGAVGAAAAALKAAKDRSKQPTVEEVHEDFVPEGVSRNKSFKERTMDGRELATTPAHSIDRLDYDDEPKMGASAMPGLHDPMPEAEYVDDDLITNPSLVREELNHTPRAELQWAPVTTPRQSDVAAYDQYNDETNGDGPSLGLATAAGAAAIATAAAMAHNRQASQEPDDEWQRTSTDRKRDTLITNPYDGASPVVNPDLLNARGLDPDGFGAGYHTGSPAGQKHFDEGYISQGPIHSPSIQPKGKAMMSFSDAGAEDPFYTPAKGHSRHLSGMSQGMGSPIYDAATGAGIERIESKDIIALMQHLMVRDAQRSARDTEILVALVRSAAEMRNSFEEIKKVLANTEDVIIQEVQENTENTVKNIIGGPRPFPRSAPRSVKGFSGASQDGTVDETTKKNNLFRRAFLKSFGAKDTNDLGRIEDMLNQLLAEVDTLKAQTARPMVSSGQGQSFENLRPEVAYEQDRGYEPEGHAGTSTASHASQSGQLSLPQSRGPSTKLGYERKFSDHRISTVPEDTEEDYEQEADYRRNHQAMLSPPHQDVQRGGSVPLATPPHPGPNMSASLSNENTPTTIKGKKHKSRGSSGWFPKISRWSESTATSVSKAFRGSGMSSKRENDDEYSQRPPSRSGSDLGQYDDRRPFEEDRYDEEQLHSGFSQTNLPQSVSMPLDNMAPPPATYMTPEDPKYKAHRNSLNLQHPQPRQGQTERFQAALESQAHQYDTPMLSKNSPQPYNSVESGYGTGAGTHASGYSPKLENRNLNAALGVPTRRPSGPRAMTPKSAEEEEAREERRRKRATFGTVASDETDTF